LDIYDSIDELPFARFQEYNRAVMIDSGIGADVTAIDRHINQARQYNAAEDTENTEKALLNMRQAITFAIEKASPESRAFVALIRRMNGREVDDLSEENVTRIMAELSRAGLTIGKLRGLIATVKKNWTRRWRFFFRASPTAARQKNTIPG